MGNAFKLSVPKSDLAERGAESEALRAIAEGIERLRYGVIQITVHDGKLVQVDVTERRRFPD